ncbi:hypothetical protein ACFX2B_000419 [Malus domestica]
MAIFVASYVEARLSLCMGQSNYDNGVIDLFFLLDKEWAGLIQGVSIRNGVPLAYELALGQKINLHKSKICFSRNVKRLDKAQMASVLGVTRVTKHEHYLGLPTVVGRNQSTCFDYIKERLWKHLQGWKDLIDHSSHSWKSDLFSQLFSTDEADLIQGIPLNICNSDDRLIWHHNWSITFMDCPMESKCSSQGSGLLLENV